MAEIQFNVNMDLVDKYVPAEDITIPQEDNQSIKFTYSIFNREVAEDLTGVTDIVVSFVKPDGHIVLQSNGTLELPNKVNIVANAQAFTYVGKVYMQVQYKKGTQTFNTRQAFFWVEKSGTSCTTVASSDFAPYLDNVIATGEMLNDIDLQALIDSKQTAENAQADVDALTPRVTTLETDVNSLKARVTAVETKNTQQDTRLTSLENQQGTFATNISNLQASDTTQNTRLTNLESGQTTQDNRLTAIETKNTQQDTRLTALETTAGDIPTMKTDITAIKEVNTTQDSRLSALETAKTANDSKNATQDTNIGNNATSISGLLTSQTAQDTKIANLEAYQTSSNTRITATETKNTTQDSRLLALEQAQPDLAPINNRLTAVETKNTAQDTRLTDLETAKATNDTKNTQQDSRLTSLENGASSLATTVANNKTAQDTVNTNTNSSLTSLTTRVTATETKNTQQDTRLDAVEAKNTSQDTKIATLEGANSVIIADINALETLTGEHESRLDENDTKNASQDSLIASNASAISSLTTTVNNNQTGINTRVTDLETAKTANDTKNTAQDNRLTALENYDITQDARMTSIEGVNTTQNTRLTNVENNLTAGTTELTNRLDDLSFSKPYVRHVSSPVTGSIATFMTDDGQIADLTVVKPMADSYGIPVSIAIIPTSVGANPTFMNLNQIKQLQSEGWEVISHTYNHLELDQLTRPQIEYQMSEANKYFKNNGLNVNSICYPVGKYNQDVLDICRKYYRSGLASHLNVNEMPINTYNVNRYLIDDYDLTTLKGVVDKMVTNTQWNIFYSHPQAWTEGAGQRVKMDALMAYVKGKSIPTKTVNEALNSFENKLEIGTSSTKYFKVGADGSIATNPNLNYVFAGRLSGIKNDTPITFFEKNKVTVATFNSTENSGIPLYNGIGTLTTYRLHADDALSFQIFEALNSKTAKRSWNVGGNTWGEWVTDSVISANIKNNTPITSFPKGILSYAEFRAQDGGDIPYNNSIGVLKTYRGSEDNLSFQEWNGVNSNIVYRRHWRSTVWSPWDTPYSFKNNFISASLGTVNANSVSTVDVPVAGLKATGTISVTFLSTIPDNILYTWTVPSDDTLRIKLHNISGSAIGLGTRTLQAVQF